MELKGGSAPLLKIIVVVVAILVVRVVVVAHARYVVVDIVSAASAWSSLFASCFVSRAQGWDPRGLLCKSTCPRLMPLVGPSTIYADVVAKSNLRCRVIGKDFLLRGCFF